MDLVSICQVLEKNTITSISYGINSYKTEVTHESIQAFGNALSKNTSLRQLHLTFYFLYKHCDTWVESLCNALRSNRKLPLKHLSLSSELFKGENVHSLARALQANAELPLQCLDLQGCTLQSSGMCAIANIIRTVKPIQVLRICNTGIGDKAIEIFACALETNTSLTSLDLQYNDIATKGAKILAEALEQNTTLQVLHMEHNYIRDRGAEALARMLKHNATLKVLDIGKCEITEKGAQAIARSLQTNASLHTLVMNTNRIGVKAAANLIQAPALRNLKLFGCGFENEDLRDINLYNTNLRLLDLGYNGINADQIQVLLKAFTLNTSIKSLWLHNNSIRDEGMMHVAEMLATNTTLQEINLSYTGITDIGVKACAEALKINSSLQMLSFYDNGITGEAVDAFVPVVQFNYTLTDLGIGWMKDEDITVYLERNKKLRKDSERMQQVLINYRRSFHAWRDRSRIFLAAREGRIMELRVRLRWGKLAGGLTLKGSCNGKLMTPLEAARQRGHEECLEVLSRAASEMTKY